MTVEIVIGLIIVACTIAAIKFTKSSGPKGGRGTGKRKDDDLKMK